MHTFVKRVDFLRLKLFVDGMCIVMVALLFMVEDVKYPLERVSLVFLFCELVCVVNTDENPYSL